MNLKPSEACLIAAEACLVAAETPLAFAKRRLGSRDKLSWLTHTNAAQRSASGFQVHPKT